MPDVRVIYRDPYTGILNVGMSRPPQYISGIDLLVQTVAMELLSSPGRDIIDPYKGANLRSLIGSNFLYDSESEIFTEIRMMVSAAESNIKKSQASINRPANEKLGRLDLLDVVPDEENGRLEIMIRVISLDQQVKEAILGLR